MLVSRKYGSRSSGYFFRNSSGRDRSGPVTMEFASSSTTPALGMRRSAQTQKQPAGRNYFLRTSLVVPQRDRPQELISVQRHHFRMGSDFSLLGSQDSVDQILRECLLQSVAVNQHRNLRRIVRKVHRSLACGAPTADDVYLLAAA
jgi:hypothetical protein